MKLDDPVAIKRRGNSIKGYDQAKWMAACKDEIKPGIVEKFKQNQAARDLLLSTGTRNIAECAPYDKEYGIGIAMHDDRRLDKNNWAKNLMGNLLCEIRDEFNNTDF